MARRSNPKARTRGAVDLYRLVVATVMVGLLIVTLSWLQGRFDTADHDKATKIVQTYMPKGGAIDLTDLILREHPDRKRYDIRWTSEILSGCYGYVRVTAYLPPKDESPAATYAFDVDLPAMAIHPTDPKTKAFLEELATITSTQAASS